MDAQAELDVAQRVCASALDILATTIETELKEPASPLPHRARRLAQVKRYLMDNLNNTELDLFSRSRRPRAWRRAH